MTTNELQKACFEDKREFFFFLDDIENGKDYWKIDTSLREVEESQSEDYPQVASYRNDITVNFTIRDYMGEKKELLTALFRMYYNWEYIPVSKFYKKEEESLEDFLSRCIEHNDKLRETIYFEDR